MKSTTKFLDSNIIIYAFTKNKLKEDCRALIRSEELLTNTLVLVESYSKIKAIVDDMQAKTTIINLYKQPNIKIIDLDKNLLFEAMKRYQKYKLKISDLIHYTTALLNNCPEIVSYDKHFDVLEIKRTTP
ncbi:PIN domain-containing protein [Candidatus Woesearchaeota archaeon]|nr:PIN domain-containing protein [Candidatus Woesearchaeota archaeon]